MTHITIKDAFWQEGDLYEVAGECEMMQFPFLHIVAVDEKDQRWFHKARLTSHEYGEEFVFGDYEGAVEEACERVRRVTRRGNINPEHWYLDESPSYANGEVNEWDLMDDEERQRAGMVR